MDPKTFRSAASALVDEGADYAQGIIDMVNSRYGWKNTLFRAEYAFWYRFLLPSFVHVGYPVPLGGTTNIFPQGRPRRDQRAAPVDVRRPPGRRAT